jgi:uncharacterized protein YjaZ
MSLHYRSLSLSCIALWLLVVLIRGVAGQPTFTEEEMFQTNVIQFDEKDQSIGEHEATIRPIIESAVRQVIKVLPLTAVRIIVRQDPKILIPHYGLGGYTPSANFVVIAVDPAFPELRQSIAKHLRGLLVHEFHHCLRWRGPGYGRTLFEAIISEGLADHFAQELLGITHPWSQAFPEDETAKYLTLAQAEFDSTTYDFPRWFFGRGYILPVWTGYTLGFRLVEAYKKQHPGETSVTLVHMPARVFRPQ